MKLGCGEIVGRTLKYHFPHTGKFAPENTDKRDEGPAGDEPNGRTTHSLSCWAGDVSALHLMPWSAFRSARSLSRQTGTEGIYGREDPGKIRIFKRSILEKMVFECPGTNSSVVKTLGVRLVRHQALALHVRCGVRFAGLSRRNMRLRRLAQTDGIFSSSWWRRGRLNGPLCGLLRNTLRGSRRVDGGCQMDIPFKKAYRPFTSGEDRKSTLI